MASDGKWKRFQTRVEQLAEVYQEKPITHIYSPRLSDLPQAAPAWSKYYRLSEALGHTRRGSTELRVFAVEPESESSPGKREFIVSSYEEFWFYYSRMKAGRKHFYEVIEEGVVCHLYFDVEFPRKFNSDVDGEKMVDHLISLSCEKLKRDFKISCSHKNVLRLDSSNDTKFSQHLIFHIPGAVFENNFSVGMFVKQLCSDSEDDLSVSADGNQKVCIVDQGVYTKNRNFRLFHSTKKGKQSVLLRSKHCAFDSGNTNVRTACCVHHVPLTTKSQPKQKRKSLANVDERVFYASLITNVKFAEHLRVLSVSGGGVGLPLSARHENVKNPVTYTNVDSASTPYPELHNFVLSLVKTDKDEGYISKWTHFPCSRLLIYGILGNRYCHNIGRQHKSNHIFYVADIAKKICYQKCHDPLCHGYRSPPVPFPEEVLKSLENVELDVTDDELLDFVNSMEGNNNSVRVEGDADDDDNWGNVTDEDLIVAASLA